METFATIFSIFYLVMIPIAVLGTWHQAGTGKARGPVTSGLAVITTIMGAGLGVTLLTYLGVL